ncbi:anti-sigma factor antagonist [Sediminispirochaeta bajacaliforniensis]|nr:anti-sigma factor antagonist [Sediminispirochaeta bajacaliforniensis]
MTCTSKRHNSIAIFILEGEMDLYSASILKTEFDKQRIAGFRRFLIDCGELSYIDSSGVGVLISVFTTAHRMKAPLFLCGIHGTVRSVIEYTKLTGFLPMVEVREEALSLLAASGTDSEKQEGHDEKWILQDDNHPLLKREGMFHKDFHLDLKKVRHLSQLIVQKAPTEIRDFNLLEQQISELIKNGVRHGNKNDPNKKIGVWFRFSTHSAHLIVEDEGEGFRNIAEWNSFYAKKREAFEKHDFEAMMNYVSFRTSTSRDDDGGNALFAAVEFWNRGVVFSEAGNCVAVARSYD